MDTTNADQLVRRSAQQRSFGDYVWQQCRQAAASMDGAMLVRWSSEGTRLDRQLDHTMRCAFSDVLTTCVQVTEASYVEVAGHTDERQLIVTITGESLPAHAPTTSRLGGDHHE